MVVRAGRCMTRSPLILAVETSSRVGSVALALGGEMLAESGFSAPLRHSAEVFPAIRDLLERFDRKPSQIEHVYVSRGPGSFTGLRIAAALAKTMHLANAARIVAVNTLDVIAANVVNLGGAAPCSASNHPVPAIDCKRLAAVLDAKRGQFFVAVYERTADGIWRKTCEDSLMSASQFLARFACKEEPIRLLGDGLVYTRDRFQAEGIGFCERKTWSPRAHNVHRLGWPMALTGRFADPLTLTPNYLRKPDVTMKSR
jgi:tRNA threonylcarbamoyladenosine biosynthesis protein TsaB